VEEALVAENKISLKISNGKVLKYDAGVKSIDILDDIDGRLSQEAVAVKLNGELIDLTKELNENGELEVITVNSREGMEIFWHTSSHILAQAVKRIFPKAKLGFGPSIENGFYYDIDFGTNSEFNDLSQIESEMEKIIKENLPLKREVIKKEDAEKLFKNLNEDYKIEHINELDDEITIYRQGEFVDLCKGPHLPFTGMVKNFKLLSIAGAYWRGDERNPMLKRIYGVSYPDKEGLEKYLQLIEEAKERDHRKIGKELDLFSFHKEAPGFPFWHPKGVMIFNEVINYWRQVHERENYYEIKTPIILNKELWKRSGHWKNYRANMYFTRIDNNGYAVKPMNCPGGLLLFKEKMWSYKDFPVKFAELGLVHRHEKAGVLHGLFRVRQFTQDDAHVFCLFNQVEEEVAKIIDLVIEIYSNFGFYDYMIELSTRPKKSIGSTRDWKIAEECLENALKSKNIDYKINKGEGAFYGPKIDFHITDCLKRTWQCGTIQVDFSMPKRFNLEYVTETGTKKKPVMIHRAILGSIERFVGVLIEHYGGDLPLWLAPTQILIIPVSERFHEYAIRIENLLKNNGFRVNNDIRNEKVGYKIREGELSKVNYMLIVGEREEKDETVSVRKRKKGDLGVMKLVEFVDTIKMERDNRN
jgi:threonyl-tRNA synthetase